MEIRNPAIIRGSRQTLAVALGRGHGNGHGGVGRKSVSTPGSKAVYDRANGIAHVSSAAELAMAACTCASAGNGSQMPATDPADALGTKVAFELRSDSQERVSVGGRWRPRGARLLDAEL